MKNMNQGVNNGVSFKSGGRVCTPLMGLHGIVQSHNMKTNMVFVRTRLGTFVFPAAQLTPATKPNKPILD